MFVKVFDDEGGKCVFYTVCQDEYGDSETDKFILKIRGEKEYIDELKLLMSLIIDVIGDVSGAADRYFTRLETKATAFPPKNNKQLQSELFEINSEFDGILRSRLRLYALRLSDSVVVLFNGGIKLTDGKAQDDPNVQTHFRNAQAYSQKIMDAIRDGMIYVNHRSLEDYEGNEEFMLY